MIVADAAEERLHQLYQVIKIAADGLADLPDATLHHVG